MPASIITKTFNQLLAGLKPLIGKIQDSQTRPSIAILNQPVPLENQRKITQLITGYSATIQLPRMLGEEWMKQSIRYIRVL